MRNYLPMVALVMLAACQSPSTTKQFEKMQATEPIAAKKPKELTQHGDVRIDNYYWLNERENPEVIAYLEAENRYKDTMLQPVKQLREDLFNEIKGRIKETDESVPYSLNGYVYYTRYEEGKEYAIHCRRKGDMNAEEEVLMDINKMAEGYAYYDLRGLSVSP
jgi:oligopeptidase B